jgi:hypothetical protein
MHIADIMKENKIQLDWIFTHGRLHGKEGIMFFEVGTEKEKVDGEEQEYQTIDPKCMLIDGARFEYGATMDNELELNTKDGHVIFSRIDGLEVPIPATDFKEMPFNLIEFGNKPIRQTAPEGHIEVE